MAAKIVLSMLIGAAIGFAVGVFTGVPIGVYTGLTGTLNPEEAAAAGSGIDLGWILVGAIVGGICRIVHVWACAQKSHNVETPTT